MRERPLPLTAGPDEEFQDPLSDYDPPEHADPLERALGEATVAELRADPFVTCPPDAPIEAVLEELRRLDVSCVMIEEGGRLVGVFSVRDVLDRVADRFDELRSHPVRELMTTAPVFVSPTDTVGAALRVMAQGGHRHAPVLDDDGRIAGIVSPQRLIEFLDGRVLT